MSRVFQSRVRDVSGAGDTVSAALAVALAAGADWEDGGAGGECGGCGRRQQGRRCRGDA